jgi:hypothetical protein
MWNVGLRQATRKDGYDNGVSIPFTRTVNTGHPSGWLQGESSAPPNFMELMLCYTIRTHPN